MADQGVDDLDLDIIAHLRQDGRKSHRELARILDCSEATIRRRVKSLIDDGHIRIVAIADPFRLGYKIDVIMGIEVKPGKINDVANHLAQLERVRAVTITTGVYDLVIAAMFQSNDELLDFVAKDVGSVDGIAATQTSHALRVVKRSYDLFAEEYGSSPVVTE